jgi:hypothetical protein
VEWLIHEVNSNYGDVVAEIVLMDWESDFVANPHDDVLNSNSQPNCAANTTNCDGSTVQCLAGIDSLESIFSHDDISSLHSSINGLVDEELTKLSKSVCHYVANLNRPIVIDGSIHGTYYIDWRSGASGLFLVQIKKVKKRITI